MKKTLSALTIAAASCLFLGSTIQAQTVIERRIVSEPEVIAERTVTRTTIEEPALRGRVVSGETLAGRREVISNDALIVPQPGGERAIISDERGTRNVRVRGWFNPGSSEFTGVRELDDDDDDLDDLDD